jgi:hypothetical protein
MASGWTNSGIDWTSVATMRESRTEDIAREIYLAVNERDYWVQNLSTGGLFFGTYTPPVLDRSGRIRMEEMLYYIYNVFARWFTDDPYSYSHSTFTYRFMYGVSSFPVLDGIGTPPNNQVYNGLDYYTHEQNGNLENLTNRSFKWLRDWIGGGYTSRVDIDILYTVYTTLNLLYNSPCFISRVDISGNSTQTLASSNSTYVKNTTEIYLADDNNLDDSYDLYLITNPTNGIGTNSIINVDDGNNGYRIAHTNLFIYLNNITGFNGQSFEIDDFNAQNYIIKIDSTAAADTWERIETTIQPLGLSNEIFYPIPKNDFTLNPNDFNDYSFNPRVYLDLNKEGFLNYYTEPTP